MTGLADSLPMFNEVVAILLDCRGRVIVAGVGTSGTVARRMAHLLSVAGTPSFFLHPADGLHGSLGAIRSGDVLIAISKGGDSEEVNEMAERARVRGASVVALTTQPVSPMVQLADLLVLLPPAGEEDPGGIIAMGSTLVVSAYGDALAIALMEMRGYEWSELLFTHPGGAVGRAAENAAPES